MTKRKNSKLLILVLSILFTCFTNYNMDIIGAEYGDILVDENNFKDFF